MGLIEMHSSLSKGYLSSSSISISLHTSYILHLNLKEDSETSSYLMTILSVHFFIP